jgi:tetratricopeptide (TPR) repeat protein
MKKTIRRILVLIIVAVVLLYEPANVNACGPFFTYVIFALHYKPGEPVNRFVQGRIGLVFPGFDGQYLRYAFDCLAGRTYTLAQQDSILAAWNPTQQGPGDERTVDPVDKWKSLRETVLRNSPQEEIHQYFFGDIRPGEYVSFVNINGDAFDHAVEVLDARIKEFGLENPAVADWTLAQDRVFALGNSDSIFPGPCDPRFPLVFQYDRFYQIASAHFYARDFKLAATMFGDLSLDPKNPWAKLCRYMVARTLIRRGTLVYSEYGVVDTAALQQARTYLETMLSDTSMISFRAAARRLLNFVLFRIDADELWRETTDMLLTCPDSDLLHLVNECSPEYGDYCTLSRQEEYRKSPERARVEQRIQEVERAVARSEEKTDWLWCFQSGDWRDYEHAMELWKKNTGSDAWFLSVISQTQTSSPGVAQILAHARSIPQASPAYPTAQYHRIRLLQDLGRIEEARAVCDTALAAIDTTMPNATINYFRVQRLNMSRSLSEYLAYSQLFPAGFDNPESNPRSTDFARYRFLMFEADRLNNSIPVHLLADEVAKGIFKQNLAAEAALAVWVRAVLLNQDSVALRLTPALQSLLPELKEELQTYSTVSDPQARRFQGIYTVMKYPGMSPYLPIGYGRSDRVDALNDYRDNWWHEHTIRTDNPIPSLDGLQVTKEISDVLSGEQLRQADQEWKSLQMQLPAFSLFTTEAVKWAKTHPDDPRSPEALHLAVRASRYSAAATSDSLNAKAAFDLLHKNYPKSAWTRKTPYWFQ